jgi:hypothetical protein
MPWSRHGDLARQDLDLWRNPREPLRDADARPAEDDHRSRALTREVRQLADLVAICTATSVLVMGLLDNLLFAGERRTQHRTTAAGDGPASVAARVRSATAHLITAL